jgi:hypothetical protein
MSDDTKIGDVVAATARAWVERDRFFRDQRALMTPEQAADNEYHGEAMGGLLHQMANPGAFPQYNRVNGNMDAITEALASPARIAYVQRRAKEIRAERAAERKQPVPATSNRPGSAAAIAAVFNAMEEAIGRPLAPAEREELTAWMGSHMAPGPDAETNPEPTVETT